MAYDHAGQRLFRAVRTLVVGDGPLKQRLARAYDATVLVQPAELPAALQRDFQRLTTRISDGIDAAVAAMSDDEAQNAAMEIVSLYLRIEQHNARLT